MYADISAEAKRAVSIARLCRAVGVSRAGYYRQVKHGHQARSGALEFQAAVQAIALEMPAYDRGAETGGLASEP